MGGAVPSMSLLGKWQLGAEKQAPRLTVAPHPSGAHAPPCQAEPCACRQPRKTGISGTIDLGFVNSQPCLPSGRSSAPAVHLRISPRAPAMLCEPTRLFPQPPCSPRNSGGGGPPPNRCVLLTRCSSSLGPRHRAQCLPPGGAPPMVVE